MSQHSSSKSPKLGREVAANIINAVKNLSEPIFVQNDFAVCQRSYFLSHKMDNISHAQIRVLN